MAIPTDVLTNEELLDSYIPEIRVVGLVRGRQRLILDVILLHPFHEHVERTGLIVPVDREESTTYQRGRLGVCLTHNIIDNLLHSLASIRKLVILSFNLSCHKIGCTLFIRFQLLKEVLVYA